MRRINVIKLCTITLLIAWLSGCASPGVNKHTDSQYNTQHETMSSDNTAATTMVPDNINDPAVRAVIESGQFHASPTEIKKQLAENLYHFGFDSSKLSDNDYQALDVKVAYLNSPIGMHKSILIQGHTDRRGTSSYNIALGERRAEAVKSYLVAKGVNADRIRIVSYGFEEPLDPANTPAAWAKNRRALVIIS